MHQPTHAACLESRQEHRAQPEQDEGYRAGDPDREPPPPVIHLLLALAAELLGGLRTERERLPPGRVAGPGHRGDELVEIGAAGIDSHGRSFRCQVDPGFMNSAHAAQRVLDPGHATGTMHAADREIPFLTASGGSRGWLVSGRLRLRRPAGYRTDRHQLSRGRGRGLVRSPVRVGNRVTGCLDGGA